MYKIKITNQKVRIEEKIAIDSPGPIKTIK